MNKKFYIATSLNNWQTHNILRDHMVKNGYTLTYDWTIHGSVQLESHERISEVAVLETKGVIDSDFVIVILPGGRGTHTELGMALALGKRVFLVGKDTYPLTCAFYHHPLVYKMPENEKELLDIIMLTELN